MVSLILVISITQMAANFMAAFEQILLINFLLQKTYSVLLNGNLTKFNQMEKLYGEKEDTYPIERMMVKNFYGHQEEKEKF